MSKRIPYQENIRGLGGYVLQQQDVDVNGEPLWIVSPDDTAERGTRARVGVPKTHPANTHDLLIEVFQGLARIPVIGKPDDSRRITGIYLAIETAREAQTDAPPGTRDVILGNRSYEWLKGLLARPVPLSAMYIPELAKGANEDGKGTAQRFSWYLWRTNEALLVNALLDPQDPDYRKSFEDEE